MNRALLAKWWWKIWEAEDSNLIKIMKKTYCDNVGEWRNPNRNANTKSRIWRGVHKVKNIFYNGATFSLGDGKKISFWNDTWCREAPLKYLFPRLYEEAWNKNDSVALQWRGEQWKPRFRRVLTTSLREDREELIKAVQDIQPREGINDRCMWRWTSDKRYSVKSMYWWLNFGGVQAEYAGSVWSTRAPLKVRIFTWLTCNNAILTMDNLRKRGWVGTRWCKMCGEHEETIESLFLQCAVTRPIWEGAKRVMGIRGHPGSIKSLWGLWREKRIRKKNRWLWDIIVMAICWNIWLERNNRTFNRKCVSNIQVTCKILANITFWAGAAAGRGPKRQKYLEQSIPESYDREADEEEEGRRE